MNYSEKQQEERRKLNRRLTQPRNAVYSQSIWELLKRHSVTGTLYDIADRAWGSFTRKYGNICPRCLRQYFPKWKNQVYCPDCKDSNRRESDRLRQRRWRAAHPSEEKQLLEALRQLAHA